jgi:hypothetical protein
MIDYLSGVMPESATQFIKTQLLSITQSQAESAFTLGAILSIALASGASPALFAPSWKQ